LPRQLFEYHPVTGYRFIPNLKARFEHEGGGYLVRVNSDGFRCDHDFVENKQSGIRRILLFGDSYTAGDGVSNGQRYSDLLEKTVPDLEVYNYGLPGSGTDQQYLAYREFTKDIEHDLLVIAVLVENIRRVGAHYRVWYDEAGKPVCYAKPYFEITGGKLTLKNVPPQKEPVDVTKLPEVERKFLDQGGRFPAIEKIVTKLGISNLVQKVSRYQPVPEYDNANNPAWQTMRAILQEWIKSSTTRVLLMPLPLYQHVEDLSDASHYQTRFKELAQSTGCTLYDPLPDLQKYSMKERRGFRFSKDPHPTPRGHAALAACLVPVVKALLDNRGTA
jgi:hypothetical protein